jgi:hypothetical protein
MSNRAQLEVRVSVANTASEVTSGFKYLTEHYQQTLGVTPTEPDHLCVAYRGERVCGTLGIIGTTSDRLRLPSHYYIEDGATTLRWPLALSVEFGRWTSESSWISAHLIEAAIDHSIALGKACAWCEHIQSVHRAARRFGIIFHFVSDSVITSKIEDCYAAYYASNHPRLYVFELIQARDALRAYIELHSNE